MTDQKILPYQPWHTIETNELLELLSVNAERGLDEARAAARRDLHGHNELEERRLPGPDALLLRQAARPQSLLLWASASALLAAGHWGAGLVMGASALGSLLLNFGLAYREEHAISALRRITAQRVPVVRDGEMREIPARYLVPGDVIWLEARQTVPADARLIETSNMRVREAAVTGETHPVEKIPQAMEGEHIALGERLNMVYMGTRVDHGRGRAVVVRTGMDTELGRIAAQIQEAVETPTPLDRRMDRFGVRLALGAAALTGAGWLANLLHPSAGLASPRSLLEGAALLLTAAAPAALTPLVTAALKAGAANMRRFGAQVRRLQTVDTLGHLTVICTDKDGPLTQNRVLVATVDIAGNSIQIQAPLQNGKPILAAAESDGDETAGHALALAAAAVGSDAALQRSDEDPQSFTAAGDSTDAAILVAAARLGLWKPRLEKLFPRLGAAPFSTERGRASTLHQARLTPSLDTPELPIAGLFGRSYRYAVFTRGVPESVLAVCAWVWVEGRILPMTGAWRERILAARQRLANEGYRVTAAAFRPLADIPIPFGPLPEQLEGLPLAPKDIPRIVEAGGVLEREMVLAGLVGVMEPEREGVREAVRANRAAGVRTVMISGDHPLAAAQVARRLGVAEDGARVLTGAEISRMTPRELEQAAGEVSVYARLSPQQKLNLVWALQRCGQAAAVTGEGVNDAPALRRSDVGAAAGSGSTEVAQETADLLTRDGSFTTVSAAAAEGRRTSARVQRLMGLALGRAAGLLAAGLAAWLAGFPPGLGAVGLLWAALVSDLPALALALSRGEASATGSALPEIQPGQPSSMRSDVFSSLVAAGAALTAAAALAGGVLSRASSAATLCLTVVVLLLALRGLRVLDAKTALPLGAAVVGLQLLAIYAPPLQRALGTQPLSAEALLAAALAVVAGAPLMRWVERRG